MVTRLIRGVIWMVVVFAFASSYVISYEATEVTVTVSNGTTHYLHVFIGNESFMYVAPGGSAQTVTGALTAFVEVRYSPGQGIRGVAVKELTSVATSTSTSSSAQTCSNNSESGCENDYGTSVSYAYSRTPMSWRVTPGDFPADTTSIPD